MEKTTITLGTTKLEVVPITLGVLRAIGIGAARQTDVRDQTLSAMEIEEQWYNGAFDVLVAGTGKTLDDILAIPDVVRSELLKALETIYVKSGIVTKKDDTDEGEAKGA